jgi:flavorubredoxin
MSFDPKPPTVRAEPQLVASDTWLIRQVQGATGAPLFVYINSLVVTGDEPAIVDTGTPANREQWLDDVFGIVDPADVRWIYLSHDDVDHTGNLHQVMERCPNATLVANWAIVERHTNAFDFPLDRVRWVNDGEAFGAHGPRFRAVRPPVFDSPTTRGLFDGDTGVYWGVDTFATLMPTGDVESVADLDPVLWRDTLIVASYHLLAPWLAWVDPQRYAEHVHQSQLLNPSVIASAHSPLLTGEMIDKAYDLVRELPSITPPECPDQAVLDQMLTAMGARA